MDLNLDGRSTDGYGDECPEFDECENYLHTTVDFRVDECDYHGRFIWHPFPGEYEALDL